MIFDDPRLLYLVADPAQESYNNEISSLIVREACGRVTDVETRPDGFLHILNYEDCNIYRITKKIT